MEKAMRFNSEQLIKTKAITKRQKSYLDMYAKQKSAAKTATAMGVARGTAEKQLQEIAKRLGLQSIREIIKSQLDNPKGRATSAELMRLIEKQNYKCALSGVDLTPKVAEVDHIIPRSKGGSDHISNLQWVHKRINRMKGAMSNQTFIQTCKLVACIADPPSGVGTCHTYN
jgi:DNA-binding CsgD family transcriptional regulator